jgi:hypothetical protein
MKKLDLEQMSQVKGGIAIPRWLNCAAAVAGTGLFFAGIFATSGPIGLYAANAILGPTVVGLGWAACAG